MSAVIVPNPAGVANIVISITNATNGSLVSQFSDPLFQSPIANPVTSSAANIPVYFHGGGDNYVISIKVDGIETQGVTQRFDDQNEVVLGIPSSFTADKAVGALADPSDTLILVSATTTTTAPTTGAAGVLPTAPSGYVTVSINGVNRQVAYY